MTFDELTTAIGEAVPNAITATQTETRDPSVTIDAASLLEVMTHLKTDPALQFDTLSNLCGVDYFETDPKHVKKFPHESRLEVVYHLFSLTHRHRLTVKVALDRDAATPTVPSVAGLWSAADWHERECFDLFGIRFDGHPNLVRILCPDDWVGHPLRKDYEQPLEYDGIRGR